MKTLIIIIFVIFALGSFGLYAYKVKNNIVDSELGEPRIWGVTPTCFLIFIICSLLALLFIASFPYQESIQTKAKYDAKQDQVIDSLNNRLYEEEKEIKHLQNQQDIMLKAILFIEKPSTNSDQRDR